MHSISTYREIGRAITKKAQKVGTIKDINICPKAGINIPKANI